MSDFYNIVVADSVNGLMVAWFSGLFFGFIIGLLKYLVFGSLTHRESI